MAVFGGTDGNDVLFGGAEADFLIGLGGDDDLRGGAGGDFFDGGAGRDRVRFDTATREIGVDLTAGIGIGFGLESVGDTYKSIEDVLGSNFSDFIRGSIGDNVLEGGRGDDRLFGEGGFDTLIGGDGNDELQGGGGNDLLEGGAGADILNGGTTTGVGNSSTLLRQNTAGYQDSNAAVTVNLATGVAFGGHASGDRFFFIEGVFGGAFADGLTGNGGDNELRGLGGVDTLSGGGGQDRLDGGDGADILFGQDGDDLLAGGAGDDLLQGGFGRDTFDGGAGTDQQFGGDGADTFLGGAGADTMNGGAGIDLADYSRAAAGVTVHLDGTAGSGGDGAGDVLNQVDNLTGSAFADTLRGAGAANVIAGGAGDDSLSGGDGNDILDGEAGADAMAGGAGSDVYRVDAAGDRIDETGASGLDGVQARISYDLANANVRGAVEGLILLGTANLQARGNALDNTIAGNGGDNLIAGRAGNDLLIGGLGEDDFLFDTVGSAAGVDTITDFGRGDDRILLDDAVFTRLAAGALQSGALRTGQPLDGDDRIIYDAASGALTYDSDGNGKVQAIHFATLDAGLALTAADFFIL